jgi:CO/xanthine dehydrogenase Mo-binding subunit
MERAPNSKRQATGNSNAMCAAWGPMQQAGAAAMTMLAAAAAKRWNVEAILTSAVRAPHSAGAASSLGGIEAASAHRESLPGAVAAGLSLRRTWTYSAMANIRMTTDSTTTDAAAMTGVT